MDIKKKNIKKKTIKAKKTIRSKINNNNKNSKNKLFIDSPKELEESYKNLIENQQYLDFLQKFFEKGYITECIKKNFDFLYQQKEFIYPYPNSNIQFSTYIKNSLKYKDYGELAKLQAIFTKYISFDFSFKVISYISKNKNKGLKDTDVIDFILSSINNKTNQIFKNPNQCSSLVFMNQQISKQIVNHLKSLNNQNNLNKIFEKIKYIDIGCEYLDFSYNITKFSKIPIQNMYGLYYTNKNKLFTVNNKYNNILLKNFKKLTNISKLPFDDNYFDFVFIHSFIQKIYDINTLLKEIKRILKPNGFIFLISIMGIDKNDNILCDIINTLYYVFVKKINIKDYIKNPVYMRYFNYVQWDFIMKNNDFSYIKQQTLYSKSKESIISNNNMTFAIYQVKKD